VGWINPGGKTENEDGSYRYRSNGSKGGTGGYNTYGASWDTAGTIIGCAFDADNGTVTFYKNNSSQGTAFTGISQPLTPFGCTATGADMRFNFGQDSTFQGYTTAQGNSDARGQGNFYYSPPSGYLALCSNNLSANIKPKEYFNTVLYTPNGDAHQIRGVGFRPDLIWGKKRSAPAQNNWLIDSVRGAGVWLASDGTGAQGTEPAGSSFHDDGFNTNSNSLFVYNGGEYVTWNWKAGGASVTNNDGSNSTTLSANPTAGFSIFQYTGTGANMTLGHGLGAPLDFLIIRRFSPGDEWIVYPLKATGNLTQYLKLHSTAAYVSDSVLYTNQASLIGLSAKYIVKFIYNRNPDYKKYYNSISSLKNITKELRIVENKHLDLDDIAYDEDNEDFNP